MELIKKYPALAGCEKDIDRAVKLLIRCFEDGGKLLLCGNGGSAADCEHISGELMKSFLLPRRISEKDRAEMAARCPASDGITDRLQYGLPAVPLPSLMSLGTAAANDCDPSLIYAQAVMALGKPGDLLLAISTSGNAENVYNASVAAKARGLAVLALTGGDGGKLREIADVCVAVPEKETYKVQELHLPVYHYLCAAVEEHFFGG